MRQLSDKEFNRLVDFVKNNYGVNLSSKRTLVTGRLQNLIDELGFESFTQYFDYVMEDKSGNAISIMLNKLTTNHTYFMREPEHFEFFQKQVLPYLETIETKRKDLRIWSAGCSMGEEPYTLAMIINDYFGMDKGLWDTKVLATDISTKVLDIALKGVYPNELIQPLPDRWKKSYFTRLDEDNSQIMDRIRNEVIFKRFNLMEKTFPFKKKFHVIFCRNVMIYFDTPTRDQLVQRFHDFLEPGGYLFIGHSESVNREKSDFKYVIPAVYRK